MSPSVVIETPADIELPPLEYDIKVEAWGARNSYRIHTGGERTPIVFFSREEALEGVPRSLEFLVNFWITNLKDPRGRVVVDQHQYRLCDEEPNMADHLRGHGGRTMHFRPLTDPSDANVLISSNVWAQGRIPDWFTEYLPNTHKFVYPMSPDGHGVVSYTDDPNKAYNRWAGRSN